MFACEPLLQALFVIGILFVVANVPPDDSSEACKQMVDPKVVRIAGQYDLVNLAHQVQNVGQCSLFKYQIHFSVYLHLSMILKIS